MNTKAALWTGRVLSGLVILFLTVDGAIKLVPIQPVTDSLRELGYPTSDSFARFLGVVTLVGTALYAWPRTSLLGAVLLTGLMGGAIATHLGSTIRCSATRCSASISACSCGPACGCATASAQLMPLSRPAT